MSVLWEWEDNNEDMTEVGKGFIVKIVGDHREG